MCVLVSTKTTGFATAEIENAVCPTPAGFLPAGTAKLGTVQTLVSAATASATRTNCIYGAVDPAAGATCLAPDIYDCIPLYSTAVTGNTLVAASAGTPGLSSGICCPTRGIYAQY